MVCRIKRSSCVAVLMLVLGGMTSSCDYSAMMVTNIIGDRPSFTLYAETGGWSVVLDASSAYVEEGYIQTEFYRKTGGAEPYGDFETVDVSQSFTYQDMNLTSGQIYHYRVGVLSETCEDSNDDGEVTCVKSLSRSTPVTIIAP